MGEDLYGECQWSQKLANCQEREYMDAISRAQTIEKFGTRQPCFLSGQFQYI